MENRSRNRDWSVPRVGLTGGIASGKSLVAEVFAGLGVPVIDTDLLARAAVEPGAPALAEVAAAFGPEALDRAGELDRAWLRAQIFNHPERRQRLEAILHPRIRAAMEAAAARAGGPYQVLVVPLLFETGLEERVDHVLVVDCPEWLQRQRLGQRDGTTPEAVEQMMRAQLRREERLARARALPHDVVDNSGDRSATRQAVARLHRKFLAQFAPGPRAGAQ